MQINTLLHNNHFELFDLQPNYTIDQSKLHSQYLILQKKYHPDKYINYNEEVRSSILTLSSKINQGHNTLKSPLLRGIYLLSLHDINLDLSINTQTSPDFLITQMEFYEKIESLKMDNSIDKINNTLLLKTELSTLINNTIININTAFIDKNYPFIENALKELSFYEKLSTNF